MQLKQWQLVVPSPRAVPDTLFCRYCSSTNSFRTLNKAALEKYSKLRNVSNSTYYILTAKPFHLVS
jgi:hypothetical protein